MLAQKQARLQTEVAAQETLRAALDRFAMTLQASAKLAAEIAELATVASPAVAAQPHARAEVGLTAGVVGSVPAEAGPVYIRHFLGGELREGTAAGGRAAAMLEGSDFDLVVHELDETITARAPKVVTRTNIWDLQPEPSGLLWLLLTRPGEGITFDQIEQLLSLETGRNLKDRGKRIHQCRIRLSRILGDELSGRIFMAGKRKWVYRTNDQGWSFCWIRSAPQAGASKLIRRCSGKHLFEGTA
ncbi:MAG: hypothetical protein KGS61_14465 [Verrucomicrobia bacterium]|nr:hypothetical protein [Verrucomicrobiota bacterium]